MGQVLTFAERRRRFLVLFALAILVLVPLGVAVLGTY